jgi:hypothetical protein
LIQAGLSSPFKFKGTLEHPPSSPSPTLPQLHTGAHHHHRHSHHKHPNKHTTTSSSYNNIPSDRPLYELMDIVVPSIRDLDFLEDWKVPFDYYSRW